jgi:hypothetical protein
LNDKDRNQISRLREKHRNVEGKISSSFDKFGCSEEARNEVREWCHF